MNQFTLLTCSMMTISKDAMIASSKGTFENYLFLMLLPTTNMARYILEDSLFVERIWKECLRCSKLSPSRKVLNLD